MPTEPPPRWLRRARILSTEVPRLLHRDTHVRRAAERAWKRQAALAEYMRISEVANCVEHERKHAGDAAVALRNTACGPRRTRERSAPSARAACAVVAPDRVLF